MKIASENAQGAAAYQVHNVKPERGEQHAAPTETTAKSHKIQDKVALSGVKAPEPDFDVKKVERLKAQVQAGTYQVSSADVAQKMLSRKV